MEKGWTTAGSGNDSRVMRPLATRASWHAIQLLAIAIAIAGVWRPVRGADVQTIDWQIDITPAGDLFPALQLSQTPRATATAIGAGDGLVSVRIHPCTNAARRGAAACPTTPQRVRLSIDTAGLRRPATVEAIRDPAKPLVLHPHFDWDLAALRSVHAVRVQRMYFALQGETRTIEVRLHPLDDALYFVREGRDHVDLGWAFAGYVNPHAAVVDEVLALARSIDPGFTTAATTDPTTNLRRVATVWAALEKHGMRYASDNPALSQGPQIYSQRVRLPGEAWDERRANCIDSSVLIASILERLGLRTFIVLVPGHAFLRFDTGANPRDKRYLETTLMGARAPHRRSSRDSSDASTTGSQFGAALAAGQAYWRRVAPRLDGRHGPDYALIDIETARAYGIIPLAVDRRDGDRTTIQAPGAARATPGSR